MLKSIILLFTAVLAVIAAPVNNSVIEKRDGLFSGFDENTTLTLVSSINYKFATNIKKNIYYNDEKVLDVYYNAKEKNASKPVVIYIYGGYWMKGNKVQYTNMGQYFYGNDYVAVIPNYVLFPYGDVEEMVDDVYESIQWTYRNIRKYGGNPKDITVIGHSAGAHLLALTMVRSALYADNYGRILRPLPNLTNVVLLNGPYDFDDFAVTQKELAMLGQLGIKIDPTQFPQPGEGEVADNGPVEYFASLLFDSEEISPCDLLREKAKNSIKNIGTKKIVLVHSTEDALIPAASAEGLFTQLKRTLKCNTVVEKYTIAGMDHNTLVNGIMNGNEICDQWIKKLLAKTQ